MKLVFIGIILSNWNFGCNIQYPILRIWRQFSQPKIEILHLSPKQLDDSTLKWSTVLRDFLQNFLLAPPRYPTFFLEENSLELAVLFKVVPGHLPFGHGRVFALPLNSSTLSMYIQACTGTCAAKTIKLHTCLNIVLGKYVGKNIGSVG